MLATMSPEEFSAAARERELEEWRSINRFCGKCGSSMQPHANAAERALVCPKCGYAAYPKLSPAVIVLVTKGNKILLQRNTHYKLRNWTLVAGFVDAGENFEDAVRREVMEEASIEVRDLRYFGSQTWPFPSNIMIGFRAEYASGELTADGEAVVESGIMCSVTPSGNPLFLSLMSPMVRVVADGIATALCPADIIAQQSDGPSVIHSSSPGVSFSHSVPVRSAMYVK